MGSKSPVSSIITSRFFWKRLLALPALLRISASWWGQGGREGGRGGYTEKGEVGMEGYREEGMTHRFDSSLPPSLSSLVAPS